MARLLITGGAGFIGSHTCVVLLEAGHDLVVLDDFSNSSPVALDRVQELAGHGLQCIKGDVRDAAALQQLFAPWGWVKYTKRLKEDEQAWLDEGKSPEQAVINAYQNVRPPSKPTAAEDAAEDGAEDAAGAEPDP